MSEKGFIKLDRQLMEHALWQEKPFDRARAWVDLLMMANYKDHDVIRKGKLEHRKRGEVNTSIGYLAQRWGWSENKVRRYLRLLSGSGMCHTNGSADGSTIRIENYTKFQDGWRADGRPNERTDGRPNGRPDGRHDNKGKEKEKKGKENNVRSKRTKSSFLSDLEAIIEGSDDE